jgi:hypothetical protein
VFNVSRDYANDFHNHYCANRSVGIAAIFVGYCAMLLFAVWRAWIGKPHPPDSGAFFLAYQAIAIFVAVVFFTAFKCLRERVVIGLSLLTPVTALSFAALPRLASFRPMTQCVKLAAWTAALVISLSMLASALRSGKRNQGRAK